MENNLLTIVIEQAIRHEKLALLNLQYIMFLY